MAVTMIKPKDDIIFMFKTTPVSAIRAVHAEDDKELIHVMVTEVTYDMTHLSDVRQFEYRGTEEEYHKKLREQAGIKNHLIKERSTNPEWNPKQ